MRLQPVRTRRRRSFRPGVGALEARCLLTGASAIWLGQDGHDLVGPSSTPGPDGIQDIDIELEGLPTNLSIVKADIVGAGGGEWTYNGISGAWAAALVQIPGGSTADLYFEPYQVETGRSFSITLTYSDGSTAQVSLQGGTANPNLWMPGFGVTATWIGQDGQDWTGNGPDVGPDGIQDIHVALSNLATNVAITSVTVSDALGDTWQSGLDPGPFWNAEVIPNASDPTRADLFFNPDRDLNGVPLTVTLAYANGKTDSTTLNGGHSDPTLEMPAPAPISLTWNTVSAQWIGQDGQDLVGPGDVHIALSGLPVGHKVVAALLNDPTRTDWSYTAAGTAEPDPNGLSLAFQPSATDPTRADIDFPPDRDESNATMTLRLVLDDGTMLATTFAGGSCDPGLRSPSPASSSINAQPGANLNALANEYGTVHLAAGTYNLSAPLVLTQPVTITADAGTTLLFSQPANAPTWTAAIKVMAGHTTLEGFAVRFAGPINWTANISYGPAVIGTTDNFDPNNGQPIEDVTLTHLDLQAPPAATSWEATPSLLRLVSAQSGVVSDNTLKGGTTEFIGGPWQVVGNTYEGTVPNTYTATAFAGHYTHDVTIANNTAEPVGPSGKTWRFLVLTQYGTDDVVQNNTVVGIGPQDSDTVPSANAPEVLLTEAYRLHFEGIPSAISPDGRIVQISSAPGGAAEAGDVVSILSGPDAGQWRRIDQAISPTAYLLDSPLPSGSDAVSISTGFVNETFEGNTIDSRGSTTAEDMVFAGNHFGLQVLDNTLIGGGTALQIDATATESPLFWGWSHAPVLGATIEGNTIEDSILGARLYVEHSPYTKSSDFGRVYFSGTVSNNTGIWTAGFVTQELQAGVTSPFAMLTIGDLATADPGEMVLAMQGNQVEGPASVINGATMKVNAATINGQATRGQGVVLPTVAPPPPPTGLRLVNDNGISSTDGITSDAHLEFNPLPGVAGYEYRTSGMSTYLPVSSPSSFLPAGLASGFNTVLVRGFNAAGQRGLDAIIVFIYDASPRTVPGSSSALAMSSIYQYQIGGSGPFVPLGQEATWPQEGTANGALPIVIRTVAPLIPGGLPLTTTPTPTPTPITSPTTATSPAPASSQVSGAVVTPKQASRPGPKIVLGRARTRPLPPVRVTRTPHEPHPPVRAARPPHASTPPRSEPPEVKPPHAVPMRRDRPEVRSGTGSSAPRGPWRSPWRP
jgi:hypothetical protein